MWNTQSRWGSAAIWLAVIALVIDATWVLFRWPHPTIALRGLLDSDVAAFAARNQILLAGLLGAGALAFAYVWNGWRNRLEARHAVERRQRRLGGVLASDALGLASVCEATARQIAAKPAASASVIAGLASALHAGDHAVLAASAGDLARLGPGVSSAARALRGSVRRLAEMAHTAKGDDAVTGRQLAIKAMETALVARASGTVFEALAKRGVDAADALRQMPLPEIAEIEKMLGLSGSDTGAKPSRLHTVA